MTPSNTLTLDQVREYYGRVLQSNKDLKTTACCAASAPPAHIRPLLERIHPEVLERFYGCGAPFPLGLRGCTVLDLGCGAGRDVYLLSQLVGPEGKVIGVDMTPEQLAIARRHEQHHMQLFGYKESNVEFRSGYIEDLRELGIETGSVDVVVSNCVFNLSPDKSVLYREIVRVLKNGGELYFSDVFADRRLPEAFGKDPVLLGECLGGALYAEDFRRMMAGLGIPDCRRMSQTPIAITNDSIARKAGHVSFSSVTMRAFKVELEDRCEDYGQAVRYRGTLAEAPITFVLDDHHRLTKGKVVPVCLNTANILSQSRYRDHFEHYGDTSVHYGLFPCDAPAAGAPTSGACC